VTPARAAAASLEAELQGIVVAAAAHPLTAVDLRVERRAGAAVVAGRVLTFRQAEEVRRRAAEHGAEVALEVVADPEAGLEEGWVELTAEPVDVWRAPGSAGQEHARQTQYLRGDGPLRRLGAAEGLMLVQGADLTLGWAEPGRLAEVEPEPARAAWAGRRRVPAGEASGGVPANGLERLLARAYVELGVPYLWGGTTHAGFDCSGLVQRVFSDALGLLLPKHTGDQRHAGGRVPFGEAAAGDLLFATPRGQRVGHVLLFTASDRVLHACRTEGRVIEEGLGENAARYQHQGVRRVIRAGGAS